MGVMGVNSLTIVLTAAQVTATESALTVAGRVGALASDGADVVWYNEGAVSALFAGTSSPRRLFEATEVTELFIDAEGVVASAGDGGRYELLAWSRADGKLSTLAARDGELASLAADASHVYWFASGPDAYGPDALFSVPRAGGKVATVAAKLDTPWSMVLDGNFIYFTTMGSAFDKPLGRPDGTISRIKKTGRRVVVLFKAQFEPDNLAIDGSHLYWSDGRAVRGENARSAVWRGKKTGGKARRLGTVNDVVADLVVCRDRLVTAIPGNPRSEAENEGMPIPRGSIRFVPTSGGRLSRLTSQVFDRPMHATVTADALWWADGAGLWSLPLAVACPTVTPAAAPPRRRD